MGNDPDIKLPVVPGHELAGEVVALGSQVANFRLGDRVTLVRWPDEIDFVTAASLGCLFATSYRAVVDQGKVKCEQWVAVHGCGGVGLSAIMIAAAFGARVIAIDIAEDKLAFAKEIGAEIVIDSRYGNPVEAILDITDGGAHISIDALGHPEILMNSVSSFIVRRSLDLDRSAFGQLPGNEVVRTSLELVSGWRELKK